MMGLSGGRKSFRIGLAVLIQYRSVTDTQPATQPRCRSYYAQRSGVEPKKEGRKERHPKHDKLAIRPDHLRHRIKIKLCVVGGLWCVVIHVKCDPNRLRSYCAVGGRKWPFPITLAGGLYTVQAVKYVKLC